MAEWPGHSRNMHEDVPTWKDNCFCEPEPRWQELQKELDGLEELGAPAGAPERTGRSAR